MIVMKGKLFLIGEGSSMTAIAATMTGLAPYILVEWTDSEVMEAQQQEYYTTFSQEEQ